MTTLDRISSAWQWRLEQGEVPSCVYLGQRELAELHDEVCAMLGYYRDDATERVMINGEHLRVIAVALPEHLGLGVTEPVDMRH